MNRSAKLLAFAAAGAFASSSAKAATVSISQLELENLPLIATTTYVEDGFQLSGNMLGRDVGATGTAVMSQSQGSTIDLSHLGLNGTFNMASADIIPIFPHEFAPSGITFTGTRSNGDTIQLTPDLTNGATTVTFGSGWTDLTSVGWITNNGELPPAVDNINVETLSVPEPGTGLLLAAGLGAVALRRPKRKKADNENEGPATPAA